MDNAENNYNFNRIAKAIHYIQENFQSQPSLSAIADHIHLSPFHFHKLFQQWAGTTPKKFLQYISIQHAKNILKSSQSTSIATLDTGLSSSSRLHELFVNIEAMTPYEYKNQGAHLTLHYSMHQTPFGQVIVASSPKGICHIAFVETIQQGIMSLKKSFNRSLLIPQLCPLHLQVEQYFKTLTTATDTSIPLHVKGTAFQLKVWEALLKIPTGGLCSYGHIASLIGSTRSSRAVGTAIASNPIAYLIPCHRVIRATGILGGYMWDPVRKAAIIGWENAFIEKQNEVI